MREMTWYTASEAPGDTDTFFKKFTAEGFYKIMQAMGVEIVFNHADYRLMSKRALEGLSEFREVKSVPARYRATHWVQVGHRHLRAS